jgi:hypothetical protein
MAVNPFPMREGFGAPVSDAAPAATVEQPEIGDAAPVIEESWPITVKLVHTKPIRNHRNELIEALTFRQPTGGDINRCGNPVRISQDGDVIIDERKMTLMMASLSGVLSPVLETIDPRDWNSAAYRLRPFFLPEPNLAW